ncbi:MAG TPA: cyclic nucleotide-binding domain-containing protein [Thermodesulfobacteriota bacterium]|nr:cyclic nucleotide-binding domain-containing protein [Thermodesulfobacteriota bacterium]
MKFGEGLAGTWFFKGFEKAQLDALMGLAQEFIYPVGKEVVSEGDPAETFYVLLAGTVSLKMNAKEHGELVIGTLRQTGEIFGWSALVEGGRSTASAECLEESYVLAFGRKDMENLFAKDPQLGYQFMKKLASLISRRLENTRALLRREIS